jgi:hypothetical protein
MDKMNKTKISSILICILLVLSSIAYSQVSEQSAKITQLVGSVEVRSGEKATWRSAKVGMPVKQNWDIRTLLESSAEITIETGTVIKIGENSVISLAEFTKNEKQSTTQSNIKVLTGQMWANVKKISNTQSKMDFETPTAVASIRGTRLGIEVKKERTRIDVFEGIVAVRKRNSNQSVSVKPNFRAEITNNSNSVTVVDFKEIKSDTSSYVTVNPADPFSTDSATVDSSTNKATISDSSSVGGTVPSQPDSLPAVDSLKQSIIDSTTNKQNKPDTTNIKVSEIDTTKKVEEKVLPVVKAQTVFKSDTVVKKDSVNQNTKKNETEVTTTKTINLQLVSPVSGSIVSESPVILRGKSTAGATVKVNNKSVETGSDGVFAEMLELKAGKNIFTINASLNGKVANQQCIIEYHPKLELSVQNIENNMEVSSKNIQLDITVSENAKFSLNGKEGETNVSLLEGKNTILVEAWDLWNQRTMQQIVVTYKPEAKFTLNVVSPANGIKTKEPYIQVTGSTIAGAKVYVNNVLLQVGRDGFFSSRTPIADEPQEYTLEIRAEYGGNELIEERVVVYEPVKEKIQLEVTSPQNGQIIDKKSIRVTGKTSPQSQVTVNDLVVPVMTNGTFLYELQIQENDIGEFTIDIDAKNNDQEISKKIDVIINGKSNQVNTSVPQCIVQAPGQQAVRIATVNIQALDRTPDDKLTIEIKNNGVKEMISTESGNNEQYAFLEGKNQYSIVVRDMANNVSNSVTGQIYYLPGPLNVSFIEPSSNPLIISGVPPMPGKQGIKPVRVIIEIEDGIGTVPETIKYCKLTGNGQTILLRNNNDYIYKGEIPVIRGKNYYTVFIEDLAGNTISTRLEISIE